MGGGADEPTQVVTVEDVTVEKHLQEDGPQRVAVSFEIRSNRLDAVDLRLRDPVPHQVTVGFDPDFGGENWSRTDQGVEFERVLEAGETCRTAYAIANISEADLSLLTEAPTLEVSSQLAEPDDPLDAAEIAADTEPLEGVGDLDFDLSMDDPAGFDLGDTTFDDEGTVVSPMDDPHAGAEDASESGVAASSSILDEVGYPEDAEWSFEEAFEQTNETQAEPPTADPGTKTQSSAAGIEPSGAEGPVPSEPDEDHGESLGESEAVGQPSADAASDSAGWISASLNETIEELEAATAEFSDVATGSRTAPAELQDQLETVRDRLDAIEDSLESVENQSTNLATVVEQLQDSIRALESTVAGQEPGEEPEAPELYATISDIAEEISLLKSALASNLETAHQHRTDLDDIGAEVEQTGDTVETIADQSQSIADELTSLRELLRGNAESLEALKSNQLALQDAVHAMHDRLEELDDRVDELAATVETED
ncbi:MAG: hypothetical protein ABEH59_12125 [Halobacteriales archaeon]